MKAIVYKDANPYIVSRPWVLELHNGGCDCGCGAVDGKVGKLKYRRIRLDLYRTKKQAQFEADTMNAIDRGDPRPPSPARPVSHLDTCTSYPCDHY